MEKQIKVSVRETHVLQQNRAALVGGYAVLAISTGISKCYSSF